MGIVQIEKGYCTTHNTWVLTLILDLSDHFRLGIRIHGKNRPSKPKKLDYIR